MEFMETVAVTVQTPYGANNSTLTPEALPTPLWWIDLGSSYCCRAGLVRANTGRTIYRISQGGANYRVIHITIKTS